MKKYEFNSSKQSYVQVSFECKKCGHHIRSFEFHIPEYLWIDDFNATSCDNCYEVYPVKLWVDSNDKGYLEINNLPKHHKVHVQLFKYIGISYFQDPELKETFFIEVFEGSIVKIKNLNELLIEDPLSNEYQKNLLFSSIISSMEVYLSDVFIYLVNYNEKYLENYSKGKEDSNDKLLEDLEFRSFHNLDYTKKVYEKSFDISFPEYEHLKPLIEKRHDIVHRNGKMRGEDEKFWKTSKTEVEETIDQVHQFIQEVEKIRVDL